MNIAARFAFVAMLVVFSALNVPAGENPHAAATMDSSPFEGKIVETMDSGGYTYLLVEATDGQQLWAACDKTAVNVGDTVTIPPGMGMKNFHSPTLDRDFSSIRFVSSLNGNGEAEDDDSGEEFEPYEDDEMPAGHPPVGGLPKGHPPVAGMSQGAPSEAIAPMDPPAGGLRIADVYARKAELAGKEVVVRGKVTRYTANVMGKNWLHIQDGSGSPTGDGDLTVTTDAQVNRGNVVTAKGTLAVDQDFGYGYAYEVLLEKADITAE